MPIASLEGTGLSIRAHVARAQFIALREKSNACTGRLTWRDQRRASLLRSRRNRLVVTSQHVSPSGRPVLAGPSRRVLPSRMRTNLLCKTPPRSLCAATSLASNAGHFGASRRFRMREARMRPGIATEPRRTCTYFGSLTTTWWACLDHPPRRTAVDMMSSLSGSE